MAQGLLPILPNLQWLDSGSPFIGMDFAQVEQRVFNNILQIKGRENNPMYWNPAGHKDEIVVNDATDVDNKCLQAKKFEFEVPVIEMRRVVVQAKTYAEAIAKAKKMAKKRHSRVVEEEGMKVTRLLTAEKLSNFRNLTYRDVFNIQQWGQATTPDFDPTIHRAQVVKLETKFTTIPMKEIPNT